MKNLRLLIFLLLALSLVTSACTTTSSQDRPGGGGLGRPGNSGNGGSGGSGGGGGNGGPGNGGGNGGPSGGGGMMGGMMGGMHARHMAQIPDEYQGLRNPIPADEESLARGEEIFTANCATCHGDGGMGDGPTGEVLEPPASPIARTSQMMGDDYLFWRISEGGLLPPFNSAMPTWKNSLDEDARWDVINYVRALGQGKVAPGRQYGGKSFDPAEEAAQHQQMLEAAIEGGVISQAEAETFETVHTALDEYKRNQEGFSGPMEDVMDEILNELVQSGVITEEQSLIFLDVHDRLVEAGLME